MAAVILHGGANVKKADLRRQNQKAHNFENMLRQETVIKLRDKNLSRSSRMSLLATDARNVGIELPDEVTLFKMVQIIAYFENNWEFSQNDVHTCMDALSSYIKAVPRNKNIPYETVYPVAAELLQPAIRKIAFPDGTPASMDIPELATVLGQNKMRGRTTPKREIRKDPAWMKHIPPQHQEHVRSAIHKGTSSASSADGSSVQPPPTHMGLANVSMTADAFGRFQDPPKIPPLSIEDGPTTADAGEADGTEIDNKANANSIDDLENELVGAIVARRKGRAGVRKKPAGNGKGKGKDTGVLKRPAANGKGKGKNTQKKPASSMKAAANKGKQVAPKKVLVKNAIWKNVHSKIYHRARDAEMRKHGNHELAKQRASQACARAKTKYLNGTLML